MKIREKKPTVFLSLRDSTKEIAKLSVRYWDKLDLQIVCKNKWGSQDARNSELAPCYTKWLIESQSNLGPTFVQTPPCHLNHSVGCHAKLFLEHFQGWYSTTSLGCPFQCLTILSIKMFFLVSNLNLPNRVWGYILLSYCHLPGRRGWHSPGYTLLPGSNKEW